MSSPQDITDKWTSIVRVPPPRKIRPGNRVDYWIDGRDAFESMYEAIQTTFSGECAKYYIYLLAWWLDDDVALSSKPKSTFSDLISWASYKNVEVRVILWANPFRVTSLQEARINKLSSAAALIDIHQDLKQSDHQKLLIVNGNAGLFGFCGGIDIAKDRVQAVPMHTCSPFHDVHCRIFGDAAYDLVEVFAERWYRCPGYGELKVDKRSLRCLPDGPPSRPRRVLPPGTKVGDRHVGILRTYVPSPCRCIEEASIGRTILNAIRGARRFIYIEDQYMVYAEARDESGEYRDVASALGERLDSLQHITILIPHSVISDLPKKWESRLNFMDMVLKKTSPQTAKTVQEAVGRQRAGSPLKRPYPKFRMFFKYEPPKGRSPIDIGAGEGRFRKYYPEDFGPGSYVHSKVWIFDDELAIIGSANCNRRGWNYDSEVAAAIFDRAPSPEKGRYSFAQQLRIKLWAKHLRLGEDDTRVVNGIEVEGQECCWFTSDARQYVRLYNPAESTDAPTGVAQWESLADPPGCLKRYDSCSTRR